jgi:hypothetical protein
MVLVRICREWDPDDLPRSPLLPWLAHCGAGCGVAATVAATRTLDYFAPWTRMDVETSLTCGNAPTYTLPDADRTFF